MAAVKAVVYISVWVKGKRQPIEEV